MASKIPPWVRYCLMQDIAARDLSWADLSKKYRFTEPSIRKFAKTNKTAIKRIKSEEKDQYPGLWIADKASRLAEYQAAAEKLAENNWSGLDGVALREWRFTMRAVAEELGHLMMRGKGTTGDGDAEKAMTYTVEGVDLENLS